MSRQTLIITIHDPQPQTKMKSDMMSDESASDKEFRYHFIWLQLSPRPYTMQCKDFYLGPWAN